MIQDGTNTTQNIVATVDPKSVAQIVYEMQQRGVQEKKPSRTEQRIKSLLESGNVDKDNLTEITTLQQAAIEDLKDELKASGLQTVTQSRYERTAESIQDALEKYTEGDDQLEECVKDLHRRVEEKIAGDPNLLGKYNRGELDKHQIRTMTKEVVEGFSKSVLKRDKPSKGLSTTSSVPGSVATKAIENAETVGTIDEVEAPHRRAAYNAYNSILKRNKVEPKEAQQKAFAMATKQYKKAGTGA
jgi:hypothetical protein